MIFVSGSAMARLDAAGRFFGMGEEGKLDPCGTDDEKFDEFEKLNEKFASVKVSFRKDVLERLDAYMKEHRGYTRSRIINKCVEDFLSGKSRRPDDAVSEKLDEVLGMKGQLGFVSDCISEIFRRNILTGNFITRLTGIDEDEKNRIIRECDEKARENLDRISRDNGIARS